MKKTSIKIGFNQKRTHTLSNGEVIWDLAGNVWEWTSDFNNEEKPTLLGNNEYSTPITGTSTMPLTDLLPQIAIDNSWDTSQSIGFYYSGSDGSGGAVRRGGNWDDLTNSGIFSTALNYAPTYTGTNNGFRCVVAVP